MSEIDKVVDKTHKLERLLQVQYRAEGDSLGQLIRSSEERLPHDVVEQLKDVEALHKKLVDVKVYSTEDFQRFVQAYHDCMKVLTPRSGRFIWRTAISLMTIITVVALIFYYFHWESVFLHSP